MQAARGTSIDTGGGESGEAESQSRPRRPRLPVLAGAAFLVCYLLDQASKALAVEHLTDQPDKQLVGSLLQLRLTYNPGAAFSLGTSFTPAIACLAILASLVVIWFAARAHGVIWAIALGVLLAGITGNLTDRLFRDPGVFRGHVVDFLMLPHWPIFNLADVCIDVAAALIVIQALRGVRLDGSREPRPR
ncbi:signal peptidase II [Nocardioides sp.]|uniref:signal peptidase II n=1 Tax=Nocardioides sp. TaxID=35761 RepID=UPI0039E36FA5